MKRFPIILALAASSAYTLSAQQVVKTGINFGGLPAVAYDADKGFQGGAILNIYNFGDGSNYPNYNSKLFFEASVFSKGSQLYQAMYDDKTLIPGIRWSTAVTATVDHAMDFYGFGGYRSFFDCARIIEGKKGDGVIFTPMYRFDRVSVLAKSDFIGKITDNLSWEAGIHLNWFRTGEINRHNINKGKKEGKQYPDNLPTLFGQYLDWGLISEEEAGGGFSNSVRLGLQWDTRDKEGAPSRGIWAEGHVMLAPEFLGTTIGYARYGLTFRHYVPVIGNDVLTFAYRLNYEGAFGNSSPFYVLPYITVMGENGDKDGMGGYRTVRGVLRDRVVGLDMATYIAEMRWRFTSFRLGKQNVALGISAFSDGTMVTRDRDMTFRGENPLSKAEYDAYMSAAARSSDIPHITIGAGFRFIMNENFIVALEYGSAVTHFLKNSPLYNQDGTGAFYINTGYLF